MQIRPLVLVVSLVFSTGPARADWLQDFYNAAGAGSNVTMPSAIASQNVVGHSGGGVMWRVPNRTISPVSISAPSLKAGCGGIDLYLGSYSFPNKAAFIDALRNFGQAAVGYFFELALRSMAPEIAVTLDVINDLAQRVNQFATNSCTAAKAAVDTVAGSYMKANARDATGYARSIGTYVDEFDSWFNQQSGGYADALANNYQQRYGKAKADLTASDAGVMPVEVNVLKYAVENSGLDISDSEFELIMGLVGPSLIIKQVPSLDSSDPVLVNDGKGKTFEATELIGDYFGAATQNIKVWECDETVLCLNPTQKVEAVKPFSVRVYEAIGAIRSNVTTKTDAMTLAAAHQTVLKLSNVPIYRVAALAETPGVAGVVARGMVGDIAEYAAIDAAVQFTTYYLGAINKALATSGGKLPEKFGPQLREIQERIRTINAEMDTQVQRYYKQKGDPFDKLQQLQTAERQMYSNLNTQLAANARFATRF